MTQLREYSEFAAGPLQFPIRGRVYTAPEIDIETGVWLNDIVEGKADQDMPLTELGARLLGDVWAEMTADRVPEEAAGRVVMTVLNDHQYGREYATAFWETGLDPKALADRLTAQTGNRAQRRSKRSTSTGGVKKTQ